MPGGGRVGGSSQHVQANVSVRSIIRGINIPSIHKGDVIFFLSSMYSK